MHPPIAVDVNGLELLLGGGGKTLDAGVGDEDLAVLDPALVACGECS